MVPRPIASPPFVLLDDSRPAHKAGASLLFSAPVDIICARTIEAVPAALAQIDKALEDGLHVAGWIAYEAAAAFEEKVAGALEFWPAEPLVWMMVTNPPEAIAPHEVAARLGNGEGNCSQAHLTFGEQRVTRETYEADVGTIQDYILAGDIYQANYTFPKYCQLQGDPTEVYLRLRRAQPVEFGAFIQTGHETVLSCSPELFVRRDGDRLQARPMKGTAERHDNIVEDREAAIALSADTKSRAENLMIVDLIRNDLSRIAQAGSVQVEDLFRIESYPTVHQMTSSITAECHPALKPSELLKALFPCGSVTGAPKIRAMEVIAELEKAPRGIYCGAIGYFSPAVGDSPVRWSLNVPIRTLVFDSFGEGRLSVGSGVVADSKVAAEYEECLLKAAFATERLPDGFHLIETMRLENGAVRYFDRHLDRLFGSAAHFSIPVSRQAVCAAIEQASPQDGLYRLRLVVVASGDVSVEVRPFVAPSDECGVVAFADVPLDADSVWRRHKTSMRSLYDKATQLAAEQKLDDILFLNQSGDVAEGAISTVFIDTGSEWLTPPVSSGALPGVLRAEMLAADTPRVIEKPISRRDLEQAKAVYIGNALRGLRKVRLQAQDVHLQP